MTGYYNKRRRWMGYTDIGPIIIPSRPQVVILTDRADGTQWAVSFTITPIERLTISNDAMVVGVKIQEGARVYDKDSGPFMDEDGEFKLMIRSGHLGFDYIQFPIGLKGLADAPQYARNGVNSRQLNMDNTLPLSSHIGYIAP